MVHAMNSRKIAKRVKYACKTVALLASLVNIAVCILVILGGNEAWSFADVVTIKGTACIGVMLSVLVIIYAAPEFVQYITRDERI